MKIQIPNFNLKAMNPGDDVYVDEQGRHIIFRMINGQVTPIKTDSNGYASWLKKQGVEIDPSDQTTLDQLDRQLEIFDAARARGGPELQQQYQEAFEKDLKKRQELVMQYYQQALENQAAEEGVSKEKLQKQKKQKYEEHKDKEVSRTSLPDRGWSSYIKSFTNQVIDAYDLNYEDANFYLIYAFDTILMKGMDLAERGVASSDVNIPSLIQDELSGPTTFEKLYSTRYQPFAEREGFNPHYFLTNQYPSMEKLNEIFADGGEAAKDLENTFYSLYERMYKDFNPESEDRFTELDGKFSDVLGIDDIPEELPSTFGTKEASSLMSTFRKKSSISPLKAAHTVTLHSLSRIFESIPESERVRAAVSLADDKTGLHAVHKDGYRNAYKESEGFGMSLSNEAIVESILRDAASVQGGTTTDKINAMKRIAHNLGRLDGYTLIRTDNKGYQSHVTRWSQASTRAGRAKDEGPGLINAVLDDGFRQANIIPNSVLKVPSFGEPEKPKEPDFDEVTKEEVTLRENEVYPGFFREEGRIVSEDGFGIDIVGRRWDVYSPSGDVIGSVSISPGKSPEDVEKAKNSAFNSVKQIINSYNIDQQDIEEAQEENRRAFSNPVFNFDFELSEKENEIVQQIDLDEYDVNEIIPNRAFRVSRGDKSLDLVYKDKLYFVEKDSEGGMNYYVPSVDSFQEFFAESDEGSEEEIEDTSDVVELEDEEDEIELDEDENEEVETMESIPFPERSPSSPEESSQRNSGVMLWNLDEDKFQELLSNYDYEDTGIFWSLNNSGTYNVSLPKNVREEFLNSSSKSINVVSSFK